MFWFYDPSLVCYLSFPCWNVDWLDLVRVTTAALNSWVPTVVVFTLAPPSRWLLPSFTLIFVILTEH